MGRKRLKHFPSLLPFFGFDLNDISIIKKLTHVVRCVTGSLERVVQRRLLGETEVGQFEDAVSFFGGVQQVLRLVRRPAAEGEK